jgi:uncharacterized membrane protein YcaP (DUF421 family)
MPAWLTASGGSLVRIVASALLIFTWLLLTARVTGLRTFSKMASVDFAATVASGTVVATTITSSSVSVAQGAFALAVLFAIQAAFAVLRRRDAIAAVIENTPLVLMADGTMLHDNLRRARVSTDDVNAKLREANVLRYTDVRAVVLETTGDISVMHGDGPIDTGLLDAVRDGDRVDVAQP